jgi:hypothetical protein
MMRLKENTVYLMCYDRLFKEAIVSGVDEHAAEAWVLERIDEAVQSYMEEYADAAYEAWKDYGHEYT